MTYNDDITNIADLLDLSAYAGDFAGVAEYVSVLNCDLPDGITLHRNGDSNSSSAPEAR